MKRRTILALPWLALATRLRAQSFPVVRAGVALSFPRDHGAHQDFRTEWWYITGWLATRDREVGFQLTFFRTRPGVAEQSSSRFAPRQLMFAHAAIADPEHGRLRHDQRAARAGLNLAGADENATHAWIDDWSLRQDGNDYSASLPARGFSLALRCSAANPVLLQGDHGYSRKGPRPEQASYYYSRPQLETTGRIDIGNNRFDVTGRAWLDHEWSSEYLAPGAVGWDWLGVNLDDGGAVMAFRIRDAQGATMWAGGALRSANGGDRTLGVDDIRFTPGRVWTSPRTSIGYPVEFAVDVDGVTYTVAPMMDDQELDSRLSTGTVYWEGAVTLLREGRRVGRGYLELTGYGGALRI
ncbi:MAG TPA: carotenoid 1,2-hydratase [Casimicrobiaceae bacterium]|nr:carotenoid 1,2-hydratase [Casimicrobiaceae bacterium]